jgi:hypothetical protein
MNLRVLTGVLMNTSMGMALALWWDGYPLSWTRVAMGVAVSLGLVTWGSLRP